MTTEAQVLAAQQDRVFFGHPRGLGYLSFAEAWERFSFYGMQALLVLYMTQQLFLPGHVEHVAGFALLRAGIEHRFGHLSPAALASMIFGLYGTGVYVTPIIGGLVADWVLGRTLTVTLGATLMALGHFLMAFEQSFLLAVGCLLVGVGCFKGNIASQVGELYAPGDLRRADAFQIYFLGINIAVIVAPLVCGTLGQKVAWHWGFGAAGVGMLLGLTVYLSGRRWLPPNSSQTLLSLIARQGRRGPPPPAAESGTSESSTAAIPNLGTRDVVTFLVLVALLPVLSVAALGNQEIFNAYLVWGDANYNLMFGGQSLPVTWLISFDAFISTGTIAGAVVFWRWWATRWREPNEITKLWIGAMIAATAPLFLALASLQEAATGHKVGLGWALAFHIANDIGYANIFPVGLALYSRATPKAFAGFIIALYYLHLALANFLVGWIGGLLEKLGPSKFWFLHAGLVAGGAAVMLVFALAFGRLLAPADGAAPRPAP